MLNRYPLAPIASLPADYVRRHSNIFARDGAKMLTAAESVSRQREIELCADTMEKSATYQEFEAALHELHHLGMFPPNELVYRVAQASLMAE